MKTTQCNFMNRVVLVTILLALGNSSASAARYYFWQDFTNNNGRVSGYFDGEDIDVPDGLIAANSYGSSAELTAFYMHFSGNPFLLRFNAPPGSVGGMHWYDDFVYSIADNRVGMRSRGSTPTVQGGYWSGFFNSSGYFVAGFTMGGMGHNVYRFDTVGPLIVSQTPTPIPGALLLFISGLSGLFCIRHKASS